MKYPANPKCHPVNYRVFTPKQAKAIKARHLRLDNRRNCKQMKLQRASETS